MLHQPQHKSSIIFPVKWIGLLIFLFDSFTHFSQAQQNFSNITEKNTAPTYTYADNGLSATKITTQVQQQMLLAHATTQPTQQQILAKQQMLLNSKAPATNLQQQQQLELINILNELKREKAEQSGSYYSSLVYKNDYANYTNAFTKLNAMLQDKEPLSIADAYYISEAAYGNLQLSYSEYKTIIKANTDFIKHWLKENGFNLSDPEALHFGIQKFISDTLFLGKTVSEKSPAFAKAHAPYYYDYLNYNSDNNRQNYFITKTLATGGGQCHTLPSLYLVFAEALGVDANLAYNPTHSFIRYKNNQGTVLNYETTVDRFMPDQFYLETLPVMAKAMQNKLYINSLNQKQVVASVMIDLAVNYVSEHRLYDKRFITNCMNTASPYFSNKDYINEAYNYLNKRLYADAFNNKVQEKGITDFSEIEKYPDVKKAYNDLRNYTEKLSSLGIQDFPESEYLRMMEYYDAKGKLQAAKKINGKEAKNLFFINGN